MPKDPVFERVAQELRELSRELRKKPLMDSEQVHELRLCMKRTRACLRLYKKSLSGEEFALIDEALKAVAKSFSAHRDAEVQAGLVAMLVSELGFSEAQVCLINSALRDHWQVQVPDEPDYIVASANLLLVIDSWQTSLRQPDQAFIMKGIVNTYRKARLLGKEAVHEAEPEYFHRWRKWTKYYLFQLKLASELKLIHLPKAALKRFKKLGELLGDLSDLHQLHQMLGTLNVNQRLCDLIMSLESEITRRKSELIKRSAAYQKELFGTKNLQLKFSST